jgi:hypothetical protein
LNVRSSKGFTGHAALALAVFLAAAAGHGAEPRAVKISAKRFSFTPDKEGTFPFHCDVFCGDGHEDMTGMLVVEPE